MYFKTTTANQQLTESSSSASASASPGGSAGLSCRPEPESSTQVVGVHVSLAKHRAASFQTEATPSSTPGKSAQPAAGRPAFAQILYLRSH